ncbi:MAG TPA: hypothetical protein VL362_00285 [Patescibacteria group bacterium]|jgi:hypothetical protein|nr:hypothetical protein [Patescibacteria group bacterium]
MHTHDGWIRRHDLDTLRDSVDRTIDADVLQAVNKLLLTNRIGIIEFGAPDFETLSPHDVLQLARHSLSKHLSIVRTPEIA